LGLSQYKDTMVFLEYLNSGMIPVKGFFQEDIEQFEKFLSSLDADSRRKINRKFRKTFRRIVNNPSFSRNSTNNWKKTYGIGYHNPTKSQLRMRRRLVHREICTLISKRIKNA
jgi:hypothetical protein